MTENVPLPERACSGSQNSVSWECMADTCVYLWEMSWPEKRWGGWKDILICQVKSNCHVKFQSQFNPLFPIAGTRTHQNLWSWTAEGKQEHPTPPWRPLSVPSGRFPNTRPPSAETVRFRRSHWASRDHIFLMALKKTRWRPRGYTVPSQRWLLPPCKWSSVRPAGTHRAHMPYLILQQ